LPTKRTMAHVTKYDIDMFAARVTNDFVSAGVPLNDSIAKIAVDNGLNREQVRRIVQSANVLANTALVKQARASGSDPRIHFAMASDGGVFSRMHGQHAMAKAAHDRRREEFIDMFSVPARSPAMEKTAKEEPFQADPGVTSLTPFELASAYLGADNAPLEKEAMITPGLMDMVIADIENIESMSIDRVSSVANSIEHLESSLRSSISDEIRSGIGPMVLKQAILSYPSCEESTKTAMRIVDEQAEALRVTPRMAALESGDMIDPRHPVITGMHKIGSEMRELVKAQATQKKVRAAKAAARSDAKAVRSSGQCKTASLAGLSAVPALAGTAVRYAPMAHSVARAFAPDIAKSAPVRSAMRYLGPAAKGLRAADFVGRGLQAGAASNPRSTPAVGPVKVATIEEGAQKALRGAPDLSTFAGALLATAAIATGSRLIDRGVSNIAEGATRLYEKRKNKKLFEEIVRDNPSFANNPRAAQYFDLVMDYAPSLAKNRLALVDYLHRLLEFPRSSVELVQSLINLEKSYRDIGSHGQSQPGTLERSISSLPLGVRKK